MSDAPGCPCGPQPHPRPLANPPGQETIAYRVGDFASFRAALLRPRDGERELSRDGSSVWKPGPGDLATAVTEWFAYLADVTTFYTQRAARQAFLRTADLPESAARLVQLLGYRPRPAVAATGFLAVEPDGARPVTVPAGFAVQSKPGPGEQPQIFEVDAETTITPPGVVPVEPAGSGLLLDSTKRCVWARGTITSVVPGDRVLLLHNAWDGEKDRFAWAEVESLTPEKDPAGKAVTRVTFTAPVALAGAPLAADYRLLRPRLSFRPWQYGRTDVSVIDPKQRFAHLETVVRDIRPGDLVLFDVPPQTARLRPPVGISTEDLIGVRVYLIELPEASLARVTSNADVVWYANGVDGNPTKPPNPATAPPVPVTHSQLKFAHELTGGSWDAPLFFETITVRTGWQPVGPLLPAPAPAFEVKPGALKATAAPGFPPGFSGALLLEGRDGIGALVKATATAGGATVAEVVQSPGPLVAPVRAWTGVVPVSRGKTVAREVLGVGDATPGQEFVLKNAPLTYLPIPDPSTGRDVTSTLRVWVQDLRWTEVATFYGRPPGGRVFVAFADDDGKTRVRFAARLPTGAAVVASYRFGAGATAPAAGSLTSIVQPRPGVKGVRNPVRVGGGSDPEPADQVRRYAPRSVLTFGRAVSAEDFEAIAARAPGVARARAVWGFDPVAQRGAVVVYVGDDEPAVANARAALAAAQGPHRPAAVVIAVPVPVRLDLTAVIDADRQPEAVQAAVRAALLNPDRGLFGTRRVRIGRGVFDSEVAAACLAVPGVLAVKALALTAAGPIPPVVVEPPAPPAGVPACGGHLRSPGEGRFFRLADSDLDVRLEVGHAL